MASISVYRGKRKTTYQITLYKGYKRDKNGNLAQDKETVTKTLAEMGISEYSEKGNLRTEKMILKEVQLYADNLEKQLSGTECAKGDKIKLSEYYYDTWKKIAKTHYSSSSFYTYTLHIEEIFLPRIGNMKIGKITTETLLKLYAELAENGRIDGKAGGYSAESLRTFNRQLGSVMSYAVTKSRIIQSNPCTGIKFGESDGDIKYFDKNQARTFLNILENPSPCVVESLYKERDRKYVKVYEFTARELTRLQYNTYKVLFRLALFSGARVGELCSLKWEDIDFTSGKIKINKSLAYSKERGHHIKPPKTKNSIRSVTIPKSEIELLRELQIEQRHKIEVLGSEWKGKRDDEFEENYIFTQYNGEFMWLSSVNRVLKRLIENYNSLVSKDKHLPVITIHCLRHTHATLLISAGVNIKTVSARLGHKNIQTTLNIYAHALEELDESASRTLVDVFATE